MIVGAERKTVEKLQKCEKKSVGYKLGGGGAGHAPTKKFYNWKV